MAKQDERVEDLIDSSASFLAITLGPLITVPPTVNLQDAIKAAIVGLLDVLGVDTGGIETKSDTIEITYKP